MRLSSLRKFQVSVSWLVSPRQNKKEKRELLMSMQMLMKMPTEVFAAFVANPRSRAMRVDALQCMCRMLALLKKGTGFAQRLPPTDRSSAALAASSSLLASSKALACCSLSRTGALASRAFLT
jgi:hypothetical protein